MKFKNSIYTNFNTFSLEMILRNQLALQTSSEVFNSISNTSHGMAEIYNIIGSEIYREVYWELFPHLHTHT